MSLKILTQPDKPVAGTQQSDAVYESLLISRRKLIHCQIAAYLKDAGTAAEPDPVAQHAEQAGDAQMAITYYQMSGQIPPADQPLPKPSAPIIMRFGLLKRCCLALIGTDMKSNADWRWVPP